MILSYNDIRELREFIFIIQLSNFYKERKEINYSRNKILQINT